MHSFIRLFSILLFLSLSVQSPGQHTDIKTLKNTSREIRNEGAQMAAEGLIYQALEKFKEFLDLRILIYGEESYYLGAGYSNVGIMYKNLGQLNLALENFKLAEKNYLLKDDTVSIRIAGLYRNIGNVYRATLDYTNALNYFEQALAIYLNLTEADPIEISDAYYSIAEINYIIGNNDLAIQILRENINNGDEFSQIYFNELFALIYRNLGKNEKASFYYQETLNLAKHYFQKTEIDLAIVYLNFAEFLFATNKLDQGLENLASAYDIIKTSQAVRGEELSRYYELMGDIYKEKSIDTQNINKFRKGKKENLQLAIKWYKKALNALSSTNSKIDINKVRIEDCISFLDCLKIIRGIGNTYKSQALLEKDQTNLYENSLSQALEYYQAASKLTQQARREISSDESKIQLAKLEHQTFTNLIETAYLLYDVTTNKEYFELAFNNSEQLKSSAVFDKLSDELAQENSLIPDSLLQYEKKLNSTISIYNQKIYEENNYQNSDSILINNYNEKIFEATKERDELNRLLEEEYADYYNLKYSTKILSIENIQRKMKKDEAIFEYLIIEPGQTTIDIEDSDTTSVLFTFLITKEKQIFQKTIINKTSQKSLENVFSFMSDPSYIYTKDNDSKDFCVASHQLYRLLILPFEKEIINKNLVFIPDGKLNYISFDGLIKNLPDTSKSINFSQLDYLIKDFNINYANSANILFQNRDTHQKIKNKTLAFAPEYNAEKFQLSNASYTLMPLPGVQKEVNAIAKTVKTKIFGGKEATEKNFRDNCKNYDILHLAMHAYINDSLPAFSRLAFSPQPESSILSEDGWLNTTDIYNLELNASLTVLSACNTGIGKLQKGEGMMSLARGFLYAGCPSIIMSLWEVEDESGTQIMSSFYKNLKRGKSKDEALRMAKLAYLENSNTRLAHPHYWMSFKSIGDNTSIYTSYDVYFFALLILLIVAFSIDQTIRIRKVYKQRKSD